MECAICRFSILLSDPDVKLDVLLERMPPLDIDTARMLRKENEMSESGDSDDSEESDESESSERASKEAASDASSDLPSSPAANNAEDLLDLLDAGWRFSRLSTVELPEQSSQPSSAQNATPNSQSSGQSSGQSGDKKEDASEAASVPRSPRHVDSEEVFNQHDLTIVWKFKEGASAGETIVKAEVTNQGAEDAEDLQLLVSVPKYIQLQMKPLSSDVVPAQGEGMVSQLFRFRNQDIEEKDTVAKLRVLFRRNEEEFDETVMVDCFPNSYMCSVCFSK